jgi:hypothetical protein
VTVADPLDAFRLHLEGRPDDPDLLAALQRIGQLLGDVAGDDSG